MGIVIEAAGLRAGEREEFWRHVVADTFVPVSVGRVAGSDISGEIRVDSVGRMGIARLTGTPQSITRSARHIRQLDRSCLLVGVLAGGSARIGQDERQTEVRAGDCVIYEPGRPYEWFFDELWDLRLFVLPLGAVQLTESERRLVTARRLSSQASLAGVVSRFLLDLARHRDLLPAAQSERIIAQASDLVVTLLSSAFDEGDDVRGCAQRSLVLRIKDYIEQRLTDPALGPNEIASAVNISTRYLYKLFQDEHRSVSQYVRERRLDRVRHDLLNPQLASRPISAIAFGGGFGDISGFNRAFKETYGITPRELRDNSGGAADWPGITSWRLLSPARVAPEKRRLPFLGS
jgi:AraC-like DNA-binding protein